MQNLCGRGFPFNPRRKKVNMEYKVTWIIELDAESFDDAAFKALEIQRDVNSIANHFTVEDEFGSKENIEIGAITLKFDDDEKPPGLQELMELLESVSNAQGNDLPIDLAVGKKMVQQIGG